MRLNQNPQVKILVAKQLFRTGVQSCLCAGDNDPLQYSCCSCSLLAVSVARPQQALLQLSPMVRYPPPVPLEMVPRYIA